jgi:hydroxymethylbilane synthase
MRASPAGCPANAPCRNPAVMSAFPVQSRIVIASRESRLAMWQAEHIRARLSGLYPETVVDILGMTTKGDQILDRPLAEIGGKGLFIKELEVAMQEGNAHLAVHSMKDVPMVMPEGFVLAAISARENPARRLRLEQASPASTSCRPVPLSAPPACAARPSCAPVPALVIKSLRGNLDTRLKQARCRRVRRDHPGRCRPDPSRPGGAHQVGADARAVAAGSRPGRAGHRTGRAAMRTMAAVVAPLNDPETAHCVKAERAFSRALGGSCQVPLGGYAVPRATASSGCAASSRRRTARRWSAAKLRGNPDRR